MGDFVKRSGDYATSQVGLLLQGLADSSNSVRVKSIKRFQDYIATYRPEIYDDDVDTLYVGRKELGLKGLCAWSGMPSDKHDGLLKRVASNAIGLLRWLVALGDEDNDQENIFYARFVSLPVDELHKISFERHAFSGADKTRGGNRDDAFYLLSNLLYDKRSPDTGEPQPIELIWFLPDERARELFSTWQQQYAAKNLRQTLAVNTEASKAKPIKKKHPADWSQVRLEEALEDINFEDEDGGAAAQLLLVKKVEDDVTKGAVRDPLGVNTDIDLRATQKTQITTLSGKKGKRAGRASIIQEAFLTQIMPDGGSGTVNPTPERRRNGYTALPQHMVPSVVPTDKTFSPVLFLGIVHSGSSFDGLSNGLRNLRLKLEHQKEQRKDLVREHFGLYVQCAEGIEGVKARMQEELKKLQQQISNENSGSTARPAFSGGHGTSTVKESFFDLKLQKAEKYFTKVSAEARGTLRPLLVSMDKSRKLRSTDHVLKRLAPIMELPAKMRECIKESRYDEALVIMKRIRSTTGAGSTFKVVQQVAAKAADVSRELQRNIEKMLVQPETNHEVLLTKLRLLQALKNLEREGTTGSEVYITTCFNHQLQHFDRGVEEAVNWYTEQMKSAFLRGREADLDSPNNSPAGSPTRSQSGRTLPTQGARPSSKNLSDSSSDTSETRSRGKTHSMGSDTSSDISASTSSSRSSMNVAPKKKWLGVANGLKAGDLKITFLDSVSDDGDEQPQENDARSSDDEEDALEIGSDLGSETDDTDEESKSKDTFSSYTDVQAEAGVDRVTHECSGVRVRHVQRLVDHVAKWLPCLHTLVVEINSKKPACTQKFQRHNLGTVVKTNAEPGPELQLSASLQNVCECIRRSISGQSRSGTKSFALKESAVETLPLINPYLRLAVLEVSELFECVQGLLGSSADSPYFSAFSDLYKLSCEGEMANAQRIMESLDMECIRLANDRPDVGSNYHDRGEMINNTRVTRLQLKARSVQHMIQDTCSDVRAQCRRPEWIADLVRRGVKTCIGHFIDRIHSQVIEWEQQLLSVGVGAVALASGECFALDVLRMCVDMRTDTLVALQSDITRLFPIIEDSIGQRGPGVEYPSDDDDARSLENGSRASFGHGSNVHSRDGDQRSARSDALAQGITMTGTVRPEDADLGSSFAFSNKGRYEGLLADAYESVSRLERSVLISFLQLVQSGVRMCIRAAWVRPGEPYHAPRKGQVSSSRELSTASSGGNASKSRLLLPPHIARILLLLTTIKCKALQVLGDVTHEAGRGYADLLMCEVGKCALRSYAEVGECVLKQANPIKASRFVNEIDLVRQCLRDHVSDDVPAVLEDVVGQLEEESQKSTGEESKDSLESLLAKAQVFISALAS